MYYTRYYSLLLGFVIFHVILGVSSFAAELFLYGAGVIILLGVLLSLSYVPSPISLSSFDRGLSLPHGIPPVLTLYSLLPPLFCIRVSYHVSESELAAPREGTHSGFERIDAVTQATSFNGMVKEWCCTVICTAPGLATR